VNNFFGLFEPWTANVQPSLRDWRGKKQPEPLIKPTKMYEKISQGTIARHDARGTLGHAGTHCQND
jgi:hypothetical protein